MFCISILNSFCGCVLHATTCRQLNSKLTAFYYNSVLIILLCIWQSESWSLQFFSIAIAFIECKCHNCLLELQNFIACLQNVVTHPKHFIHASKPIISVIWPRPPKYKVFLSSCEPHWSKCLVVFSQWQPTMEIRVLLKKNLIFVESRVHAYMQLSCSSTSRAWH